MRLERAREVLLDEGTRVKYDEWRGRGFQSFISFENWLSIQSRVHTVRVHSLLIIVCLLLCKIVLKTIISLPSVIYILFLPCPYPTRMTAASLVHDHTFSLSYPGKRPVHEARLLLAYTRFCLNVVCSARLSEWLLCLSAVHALGQCHPAALPARPREGGQPRPIFYPDH